MATTAGTTADVQDLMVATVEHRFWSVNHLPKPVGWLTDNPVLSLSKGAVATPLATPSPPPATSAWCRSQHQPAARNPKAWLRHSSEPSSATTSV